MKSKLPFLFFFVIIVFIAFLYSRFSEKKKPISLNNQNTQIEVPYKRPISKKIKLEKKDSVKLQVSDKIIAYAKSYLGSPYKVAGTSKNGFDCSGLVMVSYKSENLNLPRASYQMATKGQEISVLEVKKGDLLFFATNPKRPKKINHVGLVTSVDNDTVKFIHSSTKDGVVINNLNEKYYKNSFKKAKRIIKNEK